MRMSPTKIHAPVASRIVAEPGMLFAIGTVIAAIAAAAVSSVFAGETTTTQVVLTVTIAVTTMSVPASRSLKGPDDPGRPQRSWLQLVAAIVGIASGVTAMYTTILT